MSEEERDEGHGRLGRLFAALVGTEADGTAPADGSDGAPSLLGAPEHPSRLDLDAFSQTLAASANPLLVLRRFVAQLARQLANKRSEIGATGQPLRGLISICAAGGQGVMAILEAA